MFRYVYLYVFVLFIAFQSVVSAKNLIQLDSIAPVCRDTYRVVLNQNCSAMLLADDALAYSPVKNRPYLLETDTILPYGDGPWLPARTVYNRTLKAAYRVTDTLNHFFCHGYLIVQDKSSPKFFCEDVEVLSIVNVFAPEDLKTYALKGLAYPTFEPNCSILGGTRTYKDSVVQLTCKDSFEQIIYRHWNLSNTNQYNGQCLQKIKVKRPLLTDFVFPADTLVPCSFSGKYDYVFYPRIYASNSNYWNFFEPKFTIAHQDSVLGVSCGGQQKIRRTITLTDNCSGEKRTEIREFRTYELIFDQRLLCPKMKKIEVTPQPSCSYAIQFPEVSYHYGCNEPSGIKAYWTDANGPDSVAAFLQPGNGNVVLASFPKVNVQYKGSLEIRFEGVSVCGAKRTCSTHLALFDGTPPKAVCDSFNFVGMPPGGTVALDIVYFASNSTDNCTAFPNLGYRAKRVKPGLCDTTSSFHDKLRFCCDDIGDTIDIVIRVFDFNFFPKIVADTFAPLQHSDCTTKVVVVNTLPASCQPLPTVNASCGSWRKEMDNYNLKPYLSCGVAAVSSEYDSSAAYVNCKPGKVIRTLSVFDKSGKLTQKCTQDILIAKDIDYYVKFPNDYSISLQGCNPAIPVAGKPVILNRSCGEVFATYTDSLITSKDIGCMGHLRRRWTVSHSCLQNANTVYIPNPAPDDDHISPLGYKGPIVSWRFAQGDWASSNVKVKWADEDPTDYSKYYLPGARYVYDQLIVFEGGVPNPIAAVSPHHNFADDATNDANLWNDPSFREPITNATDLKEGPVALSIIVKDSCQVGDLDIDYEINLDLNGDDIPETRVGNAIYSSGNLVFDNIKNNGKIARYDPDGRKFALKFDTLNHSIIAQAIWATHNRTFPLQLPVGKHEIIWIVRNSCNYLATKTIRIPFSVDQSGHTPLYCDSLVKRNIGTGKTAQINASELLAISGQATATGLELGMNKIVDGKIATDFPGFQTQVSYNCKELGKNWLQFWVRNAIGQQQSCVFRVQVTDSSAQCNKSTALYTIAGNVLTDQQKPLNEVVLRLQHTPPFVTTTALSKPNGTYSFGGVYPENLPYSIIPEKNTNPLNGVSTYDLVLISRHILGLENISSPYRMLAADANRSNSVTTLDIVELRKLILGIYTELPRSHSWRFVPKNLIFPVPDNPFAALVPDKISQDALYANKNDDDFIAIKVGDINGSVITGFDGLAEDRNERVVEMETQDKDLVMGSIYALEFALKSPVVGFQFTLDAPGLEILDVKPLGTMRSEQLHFWPQGIAAAAEQVGGRPDNRFVVTARANSSGALSSMIRLSDQVTKSEAYPIEAPLPPAGLALTFTPETVEKTIRKADFQVFPNVPNPFEQKTLIPFYLPEPQIVSLQVYDLGGQLLYEENTEFAIGLQQFELNEDKLPQSPGQVLIYRISTAKDAKSGKMTRLHR